MTLELGIVPSIMVADYDEDERCLIRSVLELKGFVVIEAADGQQAFDLALRKHPDLILIELKLPVVSGFTVIRRIQKLNRLRQTPIIGVSFEKPVSRRQLAIAAGCVAHLNKPIEFDELDFLIDRFLPQHKVLLPSVLVH